MGSFAIRIGFVPLIDAAPLIAARERGFFADEGLTVTLHRQIGWANVRDKLTFGHLDAAHALLGMPLVSQMGRDSFYQPLTGVMALGSGGNAITVRRELFAEGVRSATDVAALLKTRPGLGRPVVGHVFGSSMHHYLVREWLAAGGLDPDKDTKLCVIPPPQMTEHMQGGYLDMICVGEPWNTVAARAGAGVVLLQTTDILPGHPEKVLAVSGRFAEQIGGMGGSQMTALVRAVMRGYLWCAGETAKRGGGELAEMLARPAYLALPAEILRESIATGRAGDRASKGAASAEGRSAAPKADGTFPNKMHSVWMLREMIRWGHLHAGADVLEIAQRCSDTAAYRAAAASLGVACPEPDFAPMELRGGNMLRPEDVRGAARPAASPIAAPETKADSRGRSPARVAQGI